MGMQVIPFDPIPFHVGLIVAKVALDFSPRVVRFFPRNIMTPLISVDICVSIMDAAQWRIWLKHSITRRKVAGLISDGLLGFFIHLNFTIQTLK